MRRMSVSLSILFSLSLSAATQAQETPQQPQTSLDSYAKRVGTYLPAPGGQIEVVTVKVKGQPVSRKLTKTVEFASYGDSAAVFCAREVVYLNAMGYRAWVSGQYGTHLCMYRFRSGNRTEGQVTVNSIGLDNRLELALEASQSLVRPRAKRR